MSKPFSKQSWNVSLSAISKETGFSLGTVSMALNDDSRIQQSTREVIHTAAGRLGYIPNLIAHVVSRKKNRAVGIIMPNALIPYFPSIVYAFQIVFEAERLPSFVAFSKDLAENEIYYLKVFGQLQVRGLVLAACPGTFALPCLQQMEMIGMNVLLIDRQVPGFQGDYVGYDARAAATAAMDRLWKVGYRRIGLVKAAITYSSLQDRVQAWRTSMRRLAGRVDPRLELDLPYYQRNVAQHAENVFRLRAFLLERRPTALLLALDGTAKATCEAATSAGFRMPGDLVAVGFDEESASLGAAAGFAWVPRDGAALGFKAARFFADKLKCGNGRRTSILLPPEEMRGTLPAPRRHNREPA